VENPADWNCSPKQLAEKLAPYYMDFIEIVTTAEEREGALEFWGDDWEKIQGNFGRYGLKNGDLEPLMYNRFTGVNLVLYQEKDERFWIWNCETQMLTDIGQYYWVELFDPLRYF
jgi:hypothetical protein